MASAASLTDELHRAGVPTHRPAIKHFIDRKAAETTFSEQRMKLEAAITALGRCRAAADRGNLFASNEGLAMVNALYDLTEVDALYDFAQDFAHEFGLVEVRS